MATQEVDYTASQTYDNYALPDRVSTFGGETDLWGASEITVAQLMDSSFKVAFDADVGGGVLRVDRVTIEVYYTAPPSAPQNQPTYNTHAVSTNYTGGNIVWAIADDGVAHLYTATGSGLSGATAPVFPGTAGATTVDGAITWTESGQYQPASLPKNYDSLLTAGAIGRNAAGERIFIVVGKNGLIKTSTDGTTWTEQTSGIAETLRGIAASSGKLVACGDNGAVITSTDGGVTWTRESSGTTEPLFTVNFNARDNSFTVAGKDGIIRRGANATWSDVTVR